MFDSKLPKWHLLADRNEPAGRTRKEFEDSAKEILAQGDRKAAQSLVREIEQAGFECDFPASLLARCKALIKRAEWLDQSLAIMQRDLEQDHYSDALGHFRQALNLSRGLPKLKRSAEAVADSEARKLLPLNWRVAELILQEAAVTEPFWKAGDELTRLLFEARDHEAKTYGRPVAEHPVLALKENAGPHSEPAPAPQSENQQKERAAQPIEPLPESSIAEQLDSKQDAGTDPLAAADVHDLSERRRTKLLVTSSAWTTTKNILVLATTASMLGLAALLIWQHYEAPAKSFQRERSVALKTSQEEELHKPLEFEKARTNPPPSDKDAWELIKNSQDLAMLREFLNAYPASVYSVRVKAKLAAALWRNVDKTNIQAMESFLRANPHSPYRSEAEMLIAEQQQPPLAPAPSDKDAEAILIAIHDFRTANNLVDQSDENLDKPVISDDHASVKYRGSSGADGPARTFSLVRTGTAWKVESFQ